MPIVAGLVAQSLEPICDGRPLAGTILGALHQLSLCSPVPSVLLTPLLVPLIQSVERKRVALIWTNMVDRTLQLEYLARGS